MILERLVGPEGVNPRPCGLCCAPVAGTYGRGSAAGSSAQAQRTKGLTVPNSQRSLPQPFLCTAHPVFRFQATYLSNLRGVTPRPAGSFRPPAQLSSRPPRGEARLGVDPLQWLLLQGVPLGCPFGTALVEAGDAGCWETLGWRLWCENCGAGRKTAALGALLK